MNNAVFGKNTENVRNHRDIKLVTRNYLISKSNYHTTIIFFFQKIYRRHLRRYCKRY